MALRKGEDISYAGAVLEVWDRYWLDGMISEYARVWDVEKHEYKTVSIGYYGADYHDFIGIQAEVEVSTEIARDIIRTIKQSACVIYCRTIQEKKNRIEPGITAMVVKGRKVPQGTILNVFWVGERPTYTGHGKELIAGCRNEFGEKIWIKAEYLKNILPLKSPKAAERKKFLKWYIEKSVGSLVMKAARRPTDTKEVIFDGYETNH